MKAVQVKAYGEINDVVVTDDVNEFKIGDQVFFKPDYSVAIPQ